MNAVLFNVKGNVVAGVRRCFGAGRGALRDPPTRGRFNWLERLCGGEGKVSVLEINDVMILIFASRESVDDFTACQIIVLKKKNHTNQLLHRQAIMKCKSL